MTESDDPYRQSVFTSGLISQAVLLYLHATNDTAILLDQHYGEILTSIANYYYRLLQDEKGGTRSFGIAGMYYYVLQPTMVSALFYKKSLV